MLKKVLLALLIGSVGIIYFIQNDVWVHDYVAKNVTSLFENSYDASIDFKISNVNFFNLSFTLDSVHVTPKNGNSNWHWKCKTCTISASWLSLLGGMIGLHIYLDEVDAYSSISNGTVSLWQEHITKLLADAPSQVPIFLKSITFKNSHLRVQGQDPQLIFDGYWNSYSYKHHEIFKSAITVDKGMMQILNRILCTDLRGDILFDTWTNPQGLQITSEINCSAQLDQLPDQKKQCTVKGNWQNDRGNFNIKNSDGSLDIESVKLQLLDKKIEVDAQAIIPITYALGFVDQKWSDLTLESLCFLTLKTSFAPGLQEVEGTATTDPIYYHKTKWVEGLTIAFSRRATTWKGSLTITKDPLLTLQGAWQWQENPMQGAITFTNEAVYAIPYVTNWVIKKHGLKLAISINDKNKVSGAYKGTVVNEKLDEERMVQGDFVLVDNTLTIKGNFHTYSYQMTLDLEPNIRITSLQVKDDQGKSLIDLNSLGFAHLLQGLLHFDLFKVLVQQLFDYSLQGQGALNMHIDTTGDYVKVLSKLDNNGVIRLPQTYNFIKNFNTDINYDVNQKKCMIHNVHCDLYSGSLDINQGAMHFDQDYGLEFAYVPFTLHNCLLTFKKDLFAIFSGAGTFEQKPGSSPSLKAHLIVDRSQLKENIFSDSFQKSLFSYAGNIFDTKKNDLNFDVKIETRHPIKIDTPFFQSTAKVGLHIQNTIADPHVSGSIELSSGTLNFPYRSLNITKGTLFFVPHQLYDPIIELTAKNRIKKYNITLQVTGTLQNHHISLESSPPLTENQIMALLLVGSPDDMLNAMVPALIMQHLKTALFDSEHSPFKTDSYFTSWLRPFKGVHLIPSFTDQTARGGLRGAIEIDVNDRWRASAQKNFSLTEDTRFEVEYLLSDDISIRGIRDERKDVGGEVEMRWKFGS